MLSMKMILTREQSGKWYLRICEHDVLKKMKLCSNSAISRYNCAFLGNCEYISNAETPEDAMWCGVFNKVLIALLTVHHPVPIT